MHFSCRQIYYKFNEEEVNPKLPCEISLIKKKEEEQEESSEKQQEESSQDEDETVFVPSLFRKMKVEIFICSSEKIHLRKRFKKSDGIV